MSGLHPVALLIVAVGGLAAGLIDWEEWPAKLLVFVLTMVLASVVQIWA